MQELDEHIDKNLKELPVKGGFKVPDGYFNDLKVLVHFQTLYTHQQVEKQDYLKDYFASSRKKILSKTTERSSKPTVSLKLFSRYLGAAASLLLVAGGLFWMYRPVQQSSPSHQLTDEEIIHYLQQNDPNGELQVEEVVNIVPAHTIPIETNEEDYLMIETL